MTGTKVQTAASRGRRLNQRVSLQRQVFHSALELGKRGFHENLYSKRTLVILSEQSTQAYVIFWYLLNILGGKNIYNCIVETLRQIKEAINSNESFYGCHGHFKKVIEVVSIIRFAKFWIPFG